VLIRKYLSEIKDVDKGIISEIKDWLPLKQAIGIHNSFGEYYLLKGVTILRKFWRKNC
jgi:hypothetical protein